MKRVILARGTGTRLMSFTKILNKRLFPIELYPMIYPPIMKLGSSGIKDILIITNKEYLNDFKTVIGNRNHLDVLPHIQQIKKIDYF